MGYNLIRFGSPTQPPTPHMEPEEVVDPPRRHVLDWFTQRKTVSRLRRKS